MILEIRLWQYMKSTYGAEVNLVLMTFLFKKKMKLVHVLTKIKLFRSQTYFFSCIQLISNFTYTLDGFIAYLYLILSRSLTPALIILRQATEEILINMKTLQSFSLSIAIHISRA